MRGYPLTDQISKLYRPLFTGIELRLTDAAAARIEKTFIGPAFMRQYARAADRFITKGEKSLRLHFFCDPLGNGPEGSIVWNEIHSLPGEHGPRWALLPANL